MLSRDAAYNMDEAAKQIQDMQMTLDVKVETQVILQLLVEKEIVTRDEVVRMRERVRKSPKYAGAYAYLEQTMSKVDYYKNNPEQHLRDLFQAKMRGDIK